MGAGAGAGEGCAGAERPTGVGFDSAVPSDPRRSRCGACFRASCDELCE